MPKALGASAEENAKWILDEKPSHHPESACERGEVKCVDAPPMSESDRKWDESVKKEMDTVGKKQPAY